MKKDFEEYLTKLQLQYNEMNKTMEKVNKQLEEGMLDEKSIEGITNYFNMINSNYQRVLYCRYLYNLPPKFIQKLRQKKLDREAKKFVEEHADKDTVINETQECLDGIKDLSGTKEE